MPPRHDYALCFTLLCVVAPGCSVPELEIVEQRDDGASKSNPSFVPRDAPRGSVADAGESEATSGAGSGGAATARSSASAAAGAASSSSAGGARAMGAAGSAGAAVSGRAGSSSPSAPDAGSSTLLDASAPPVPESNEPNPCLVWLTIGSNDRAPENAVQGGLETTAGIDVPQYVCRVKPPDLAYAVPGKAMFGNGCLVAYRVNGVMKTFNQKDGNPFEVLTPGPGCTFDWQSAGNSSVPSGTVDLSDPPRQRLYACRGDFQGPLSSGVQVGGIPGATDTPPRFECWFESYTSPMQPMNPTMFDVLVQAP